MLLVKTAICRGDNCLIIKTTFNKCPVSDSVDGVMRSQIVSGSILIVHNENFTHYVNSTNLLISTFFSVFCFYSRMTAELPLKNSTEETFSVRFVHVVAISSISSGVATTEMFQIDYFPGNVFG